MFKYTDILLCNKFDVPLPFRTRVWDTISVLNVSWAELIEDWIILHGLGNDADNVFVIVAHVRLKIPDDNSVELGVYIKFIVVPIELVVSPEPTEPLDGEILHAVLLNIGVFVVAVILVPTPGTRIGCE